LAATSKGDVIITQDGEPWIVLRAIEGDQDRRSAGFANSASFHQLIDRRRQEQAIPCEEAKKQLDLGP
jgi:hypothetical protein